MNSNKNIKSEKFWTREMVQWVRTLAAMPDDPSSIPRTHVAGENHLLQAVL